VNADSENVSVPAHLLSPKGGEHFVLRAVGDASVEQGILDGDFLICRSFDTSPIAGKVCVCLVGDETTVRRYCPEGKEVRLASLAPGGADISLPREEVRVKCEVVGLMRRFGGGA